MSLLGAGAEPEPLLQTLTVRALLGTWSALAELEPEARADGLAAVVNLDDRLILSYLLSLSAADGARLQGLISTLAQRAAFGGDGVAASAAASDAEWAELLRVAAAAPAQVRSAVLVRYDPARAALATILCELPADTAAELVAFSSILLLPSVELAAAAAHELLRDNAAASAGLAAFASLSLSSRASLIDALPPPAAALGVLCGSSAVTDVHAIRPTYATLRLLADLRLPEVAALDALHAQVNALGATDQRWLANTLGEVGVLIEAAPHLPAARWSAAVLGMARGGRIAPDARRIARLLLSSEASQLRSWLVHNPEELHVIGFFCGWFLLLTSVFGVLVELLYLRPLYVMIDIYVVALAFLTCALEAKSSLMRDQICLPMERRLPLLRLAGGRGGMYVLAGCLAFDSHELADAVGGGLMLIAGFLNVYLGAKVSPKLKKLRRGFGGEGAALGAFDEAREAGSHAAGLSAKEFRAFAAKQGVHFSRLEMQAVFLEIDARRDGVVSQSELLTWYHGHISRGLKRLANRTPDRPRAFIAWVTRCGPLWLSLPAYAVAILGALVPFLIAALISAVVNLAPIQFTMDLVLLWLSAILITVETRCEEVRRSTLHIFRYATLLLYPRPRGMLYILAALALLAQNAPWVWPFGYVLEILGIAHLYVGTRINTRLKRLRAALPTDSAVESLYHEVTQGARGLSTFGIGVLCQSAGLGSISRWEKHALLAHLDLDRDGAISLSELLYFISAAPDEAIAAGADVDADSDAFAERDTFPQLTLADVANYHYPPGGVPPRPRGGAAAILEAARAERAQSRAASVTVPVVPVSALAPAPPDDVTSSTSAAPPPIGQPKSRDDGDWQSL